VFPDGGLKYALKSTKTKDVECHANILDYQIATADDDPFGRLRSGYLRIQGRALDASQLTGRPFHFTNPKAFRVIGTSEMLPLSSGYMPEKGHPFCQFDFTPKDLFRRRLNIPGTDDFDVLSTERFKWELNKEVARVMLEDATFLQILTLRDPDSYWYGKTWTLMRALMLRANEDGATHRRVGLVEFSDCKELLAGDGWETRTFTIV
jgi:hypothetical protein